MSVSPDEFRRALGSYATGVTVITTLGADGRRAGVTVSSFSSLSLTPPLVLFCLDKGTAALDAFVTGDHFAVNLLADDQQALASTFASPQPDRFAGLETEKALGGCPVFAGTVATLECRRTAVHDGGDHLIVVGEVERARSDDAKSALLYGRGRYGRFD